MASSIEAIQKNLQEPVAPGISDLRECLVRIEGEMTGLKSEIRRMDDRIDSLNEEMSFGFFSAV